MSINLNVAGSPTAIHAVATWLDSTLQAATGDAAQAFDSIRDFSTTHWQSWSGENYRSVLVLGRNAGWEVESIVADTAEKLHAYAGQLERMENHFADHRDSADAAGLVRSGNRILEPVNPLPYSPNSSDPRYDEFLAHVDRVDLYNEISADVGTRWGELQVWVEENLVDFLAGRQESAAVRLLNDIVPDEGDIVGTYLDGQEAHWEVRLAELQIQADEMRRLADQALNDLESDNPQVRAAAEEVRIRSLGHGGVRLQSWVDDAAEVVRAIPVLGRGLDVLLTGQGLAEGDDVGGTIVEIVVGTAAGAVATAALVAVGAGVLVTVAVPAAVTVVVGGLGAWVYEEAVPQQVREDIDAGWRDFWGDAADLFVDVYATPGQPAPVIP